MAATASGDSDGGLALGSYIIIKIKLTRIKITRIKISRIKISRIKISRIKISSIKVTKKLNIILILTKIRLNS